TRPYGVGSRSKTSTLTVRSASNSDRSAYRPDGPAPTTATRTARSSGAFATSLLSVINTTVSVIDTCDAHSAPTGRNSDTTGSVPRPPVLAAAPCPRAAGYTTHPSVAVVPHHAGLDTQHGCDRRSTSSYPLRRDRDETAAGVYCGHATGARLWPG